MTRTTTALIASGVLAAAGLAVMTYVAPKNAAKPPDEGVGIVQPAARTADFSVEGMSCVSCVASIKSAVGAIDGVRGATVSLEERRAQVEYDPSKTSPEQIASAITKAGYTVVPHGGESGPASEEAAESTIVTVSIPVEGMSCAACTASVKEAVTALEGVRSAEVDLAAKLARIEFTKDKVTPEQIAEAISKLGFKPGKPLADGGK